MARFSERTITVLQNAGWYEGRSVDITPAEEYYREDSFNLFPPVKQFLQEFGDLKVADREMFHGHVLFYLKWLAIEPEWIERYVAHLNRPLSPIGNTANSAWLMDSEGNVYDTDFGYLILLGSSGDEALENVISNRKGIVRLLDDPEQ